MMLTRLQIFNHFIIVLVCIFVLDKIVYFSAKSVLSFSSYRFIDFYNEKESYDVLILGNSRANQSLPRFRLNDYTIKNFGEGWAGVPQQSAMAHDYVSLHGAPKYLLIETHFLDYTGTGRKQGAIQAIFSTRVEREISVGMSSSEKVIRKLIWSGRLNESNLIPAIVRIFLKPTSNYGSSSKVIRPEDIQYAKGNATKITFQSINNKKLTELINDVRVLGTEVYFVTTPIFGDPNSRFNGFDDFIKEVDIFSARHNVLHLDLSKWSPKDIFYSDTTHLNTAGAKEFSQDFSACFLKQDTGAYFNMSLCREKFPQLNVIAPEYARVDIQTK